MDESEITDSHGAAGGDAEAPTASRRAGGLREKVLIAALAAILVLWGVDQLRQRALRAEAAPLAEAAMNEHRGPDVETASELTVTRKMLIFGAPTAKIEVFVRNATGGADREILGVEYEYALEDGTWKLQNSSGCSDATCATRGKAAFDKN